MITRDTTKNNQDRLKYVVFSWIAFNPCHQNRAKIDDLIAIYHADFSSDFATKSR